MNKPVTRKEAAKYVGKNITAVKKDGTIITGKLVKISGNRLIVRQPGKKVKTKAILPLALFDLLAIGTSPFAFGGYGFGGYPYGYGGFGGYGYGYPYGFF
ncbi:hypothetical protein [Paenibacillus woosongensis]|uniref:50S ribosomal protein L33 n=1 Tax=Paenibacillus woosongensis TaxID=307580 RepID=A0A7X2YXX9_9BACL|nr:hypothetical protein [Paenibacillus woosongensis]MUG43937.1 hypothetical protein [Paenibacillus woosongensis]